MPKQLMTYAELATLWGVSREAARKKVEGLRLQRQTGNDGKARVMIDLEEVSHTPLKPKKEGGRKADGDRAETEALRGHVESLRAEIARMEALAGTHRADFERERERAEKLAGELVGLIDRLTAAEKERTANAADAERARADLAGWKARPWWQRAFA